MAGGVIQPKGRRYWYVWFPWKGDKIWIRKYLDGSKMFAREQGVRILEKIRGEIDQGIFDPLNWGLDKPLLIENAWNTYQDLSPVKKDRYAQRDMIFDRYILPYFKGKSLRDIRTIDVATWLAEVAKQDPAPAYLRLIRATFRAFLWFHSDNLPKMPKFPTVKVPRKSPPWLTEEEQGKVFEFVPSQHQGILRFIKAYGCRVSEACNLRKADIDWGNGALTFRERKAGDENVMPLTEESKAILRTPRKVDNLEYAFCTARGLKYRRQALYSVWARANGLAHKMYGVRIVPLKNATRHSLASQLANRGEPLGVIARILGNSEKVVAEKYRVISTEKVAEVMTIRNVTTMLPYSKG